MLSTCLGFNPAMILARASTLSVEQAFKFFRKLATITGGAFCRFDGNSAKQLAELLRAVTAFACGGIPALANQNSDSARLLLRQMK